MIFVNFKTYQQGTGEAALGLAKICRQVEEKTKVKIIPVVQAVDIFRLNQEGFEVWAQHIDDISFGPYTGQVLPEAVIAAGAKGVLLNHSECKLPVEVVGSIIQRLKTIEQLNNCTIGKLVCAESVGEAKEISQFKPSLIAYEPPELIGGDVSVSSAKPEIIRDFVSQIKEIPVLVGAGIHTQDDVRKAIGLGAVGVLVSSGVVLTKNPRKVLLDLASGFKATEAKF